jgi:putative transposase
MTKTIPLEPGNYYHIYNRGNNKEHIFREHDNYVYFLQLLIKHILPVANIYGYCLLTNHFHLIIKIKEDGVEKPINPRSVKVEQHFSNFFNAYAKSFNIKYNRTGKLFQERFKRKKIDSDDYLTQLIYYIHANPQLHKVISDFRNYPYSSYKTIMNSEITKLRRDEVFDHFGGRAQFEQFHLEKLQDLIYNDKL